MKTNLQKIREEKLLSRAQLAALSGIKEKTVYNIEENKTVRVQDRIRRGIVGALGVSHAALFNKQGVAKVR